MSITVPTYTVLPSDADCHSAEKQWYAAYTCPRHEKQVLSQLQMREVEAFLPTYKAVHRWKNGVTATLDLALFPGYVFVHINLRDQLRILRVPSLVNLVGFGNGPTSLPRTEVEVLKNGLSQLSCEPHPFMQAGQRVAIKSGPLSGISGILIDRRSHGYRLVVNVELLRQACAVEVDACDIEAV